MDLTISLASTAELQDKLFELRYRIYVEELGGKLPPGTCTGKRLRENLDSVAFNYVALDGETVVGSLRVVDLDRLPDPASTITRYRIKRLIARFGAESICFAGRLAVDARYRSSGLVIKIIERGYAEARLRGLRFAVSDCSLYLLPLYERFGYRAYGEPFEDPIFGAKMRMLWSLRDVETMRRRRSPFARLAAELADHPLPL